jgi:hypothetical protein
VGSAISAFTLEDQHGADARVDERVKVLVLSRDMAAGDVVKKALEDKDQAWLDQRAAVYVADVSRMPGLITRMIALPRMRGRPYRVVVDRRGAVAGALPYEDGKATVLHLDGLRVTRVAHVTAVAELVAELGEPRAAGR